MTITVLLRLVPIALASGQLAGEAEVIGTGERVTVRSTDDLVGFLRQLTEGAQSPIPATAPPEAEAPDRARP